MFRSTSHVYEPSRGVDRSSSSPAEPVPTASFVFDRAAIQAVDRAAIDEYHIPSIVLMENAARAVTEHAMHMLHGSGDAHPLVLIICGTGNNGGDGYAAARHLHNRGVQVVLCAVGEPRADSDAAINAEICRRMQLQFVHADEAHRVHVTSRIALIIDAIFGTGLDRNVIGDAARMIDWINSTGVQVLAVDVPSGMDCNSGAVLGAAVRAMRTVTLVGPKVGFLELHAQNLLGDVVVGDIGVPIELAERFGRRMNSI